MRCMKLICFFIATLTSCISYANTNENNYVFVGQSGNETSFVLDIIDGNMQNISISEDGEVWLKVDKIVAIPREELKASYSSQNALPINLISSAIFGNALREFQSEQDVRCPKCRHYYVPAAPTWSCPRCNR